MNDAATCIAIYVVLIVQESPLLFLDSTLMAATVLAPTVKQARDRSVKITQWNNTKIVHLIY